jgi:hypothetical protein
MPWIVTSPPRPIAGSGQNLAIGAASVASAAFGAGVQMIMVSALGNCHVAIGPAPVAVATDLLLKATDPPLLLKVAPGEKIAVIQDGTATGNLNIVQATH